MRVAFVGCGQIARLHASTVQELQDVELVGVCDRDAQRLREAAVWAPRARPYTDLVTLLHDERPDAVHVLTPPSTHAAIAMQAMAAGCHVLVEKPMALSIQEADAMIAAAQRYGVKLCTNHNYRYKPSIQKAHHLVANGAIGDVVYVNSYYGLSDETGDFDAPGGGHWAHRLPGGAFTNFLPHLIYLQMLFLPGMGSVAGVTLGYGKGSDSPATEMTVLLQGRGATGVMSISTLAKPYAKFVEIYGTKGIIHADLVRETCTIHPDRRVPRLVSKVLFNLEDSVQLAYGTSVNVANVVLGRMRRMPELPVILGAFYDSLRGTGEVPAPGEEGRQMIEVMERIWTLAPVPPAPDPALPAPPPASGPWTAVERRLSKNPEVLGKTLVTGATGYLGRHVVAALSRCGVEVVALVRDRSRVARSLEQQASIVEGDLSDSAAVAAALNGVTTVIHCAAATRNNLPWSVHHATNITGTRVLFDAALEASVKHIVMLSSIVVYGFDRPTNGHLIDETAPYAQDDDRWAHYQRSKLAADRLAFEYHRERGLPITVLRPGVIYGPGGGRSIGRGLVQVGTLRLAIGRSRNSLPFTYLDNAIDALLLAAMTPAAIGQAYNVVDTPLPTVRDFALQGARISGERLVLVPVPTLLLSTTARLLERQQSRHASETPPRLSRFVIRSACSDLRYDTRKIREELGWCPAVRWEEGLRRSLATAE